MKLKSLTLNYEKQDRQYEYNVTLRSVRVTIVAVEKEQLLH